MIAGESSPSRVFMKRCNVCLSHQSTAAAPGLLLGRRAGRRYRSTAASSNTALSSKRVQCHELYFSVKCDKGRNRKVARPTIVWNETG